jgi:hypothetical protein
MPLLWAVLWYPSYPDHVLSMSVVLGFVLLGALAVILTSHSRNSAYQQAFTDASGAGSRQLAPSSPAEEAA